MQEVYYIRWFETLRSSDTPLVGGKNASLGEMISTLKKEGILVPDGFATTADAYREFFERNALKQKIRALLKSKDARRGEKIRRIMLAQTLSDEFLDELRTAYNALSKRYHAR